MKKMLALLLIALVLLSVPLLATRADEAAPTPAAKSAQGTPAPTKPHDKPANDKSLEYWETVELPELQLTGNLREDILIVARSQLGYCADRYCFEETASGKKRYYTRYGAWDGATFSDWCDSFVSFCVYFGGKTEYPGESSCARHMFLLKTAGYWREWNSYVPKPGDLVFFKFDPDSMAPNHVGVVEKVILGEGDEPGQLVTIEGNLPNPTGGLECVKRMTRALDQVVGYGTYDVGQVYPSGYTIRSDGWEIIGADSIYFIEQPTREALRFLGLYGSRYYTYWFPEPEAGAEATPTPVSEAEEPAEDLAPEAAEPVEATPESSGEPGPAAGEQDQG